MKKVAGLSILAGAVFLSGVTVVRSAWSPGDAIHEIGARLSAENVSVLSNPDEVKTVDRNGIKTENKTWSSCSALAPADWSMTGNEQAVGMGVDIDSPDRSRRATYGILAVPVSYLNGRDVYGTGTPERFVQTVLEQNGTTSFQLSDQQQSMENGYELRFWSGFWNGRAVRGFAHYRTFESGVPNTYIIACRMGLTSADLWEKEKNLLYDIAASVRCEKHLFPTPGGGGSGRSGTGEPCGSSIDLSVSWQEATMGFQNVYSPSTGDHWEASFSDYNQTGPDGPGYYRSAGNTYEKLKEGFSEGCR